MYGNQEKIGKLTSKSGKKSKLSHNQY